jgi:hypothetical protein
MLHALPLEFPTLGITDVVVEVVVESAIKNSVTESPFSSNQ